MQGSKFLRVFPPRATRGVFPEMQSQLHRSLFLAAPHSGLPPSIQFFCSRLLSRASFAGRLARDFLDA